MNFSKITLKYDDYKYILEAKFSGSFCFVPNQFQKDLLYVIEGDFKFVVTFFCSESIRKEFIV